MKKDNSPHYTKVQAQILEIPFDPQDHFWGHLGVDPFQELEAAENREEILELKEALLTQVEYAIQNLLTEKQRTMLELYFSGKTQAEIGAMLGVIQTTVHRTLYGNRLGSISTGTMVYGGAFQKIRQHIAEWYQGDGYGYLPLAHKLGYFVEKREFATGIKGVWERRKGRDRYHPTWAHTGYNTSVTSSLSLALRNHPCVLYRGSLFAYTQSALDSPPREYSSNGRKWMVVKDMVTGKVYQNLKDCLGGSDDTLYTYAQRELKRNGVFKRGPWHIVLLDRKVNEGKKGSRRKRG